MKILKIKYSFSTVLTLVISLAFVSCEQREISELEKATYPTNGEVFIDAFSGGLDFAADGNGKLKAFDVDKTFKYKGTASMRFDIPDANDLEGSYAGGVFYSGARDLSGYNALTFWIKGSQSATVDKLGFGDSYDFGGNKYNVTLSNTSISTSWKKIVIPIPDASKLIAEKGMFWFSDGTQESNGKGYSFWVDEVQFEKLETIAHPRAKILNGETQIVQSVIDATTNVTGMSFSMNLINGQDVTVAVAPSYFEFTSSENSIATVNSLGVVSIVGGDPAGINTSVITAMLGKEKAAGALEVKSLGKFKAAPLPTQDASNVISIFSDTYTNVLVNYYNGYWAPYQTTTSSDFEVNGDKVLNYANFNFVGTSFPAINATNMTHAHFDIFIPGNLPVGANFKITIRDFGADGVDGGGDDTDLEKTITAPILKEGKWASVDIPLTMVNKSKIGLLIYENLGSSLTNFYLDNIYFYEVPTAPVSAAPTPTKTAVNVISVFSDAYTNVAGSNLNPNWGQATQVSEVAIQGNNTLKYAGLNYQGLQLGSSQNVTGMTHLHIDYYSANSTALNMYLISSGPVEKSKALTVPTNLGWNSIDIPLTEFSPVDLADIIQLKFDGNGDIYLDNIFFYK